MATTAANVDHVDYVIRRATADDALGIAIVNVASWQMAYRGLLPDSVLDGLFIPARAESWAAAICTPAPRKAILVCTEGDEVLGFALVGPLREDGAGPGDGELWAIYLHPRVWRRGIGGRLHGAALALLRDFGFTSATLWVLVGNDRAIGFYRQAGWSQDGGRRIVNSPIGAQLDELRLRHELPAVG